MKNVHVKEVKFEGKDWESIIDKAFQKRIKDAKIDGFRKGKCPKDVYIKKYGIESLFMEAVDIASQDGFKEVMKDDKLVPVVEPKLDIKEIDKDHIILAYTIITKPEVKLGNYKNLGVKKDKVKVTNEEIEEEVARISSRLAEIVVKENGEVVEGNTAVIDFEGIVDGKVLEGGTGNNYPLEIGSHTFIPGFEEGIVGMKVGEEKELKLKFPKEYTPELADKAVTFKVKVNEIKERVLPELNKDFYEDLGYKNIKTEEEFKAEVKKEIEARKEEEIKDKYIEDVLAAASKNLEVEINEEIIEEEVNRMMSQFAQQIQMQGITLEQYFEFAHTTEADARKQMEPEATKRVQYRYLIEAVADAEKVKVTDKEADEEATKYAEGYGVSKEEFLSHFGGIDMIKYDIKMRKALDILAEN